MLEKNFQETKTAMPGNSGSGCGGSAGTTNPAPEFISIKENGSFIRRSSNRGHYGPPKSPRGLAIVGRGGDHQHPIQHHRSKRKREATSGDRIQDEHFHHEAVNIVMTRMAWHPLGLDNYTDGIIG